MQKTRYDRVRTVLVAVKRSETARLKAKLTAVAKARQQATELRQASASQVAPETAVEMQVQSKRQNADEARARTLEHEASTAEREAHEMQRSLTQTLGREQAASMLAKSERIAERARHERRSEIVPERSVTYVSGASDASCTSSVGTE